MKRLSVVDLARNCFKHIQVSAGRSQPDADTPMLSRCALLMLLSISVRADNDTAACPMSRYHIGYTVADLAESAGLSRRSGVRGIRTLEDLGLLQVEHRVPLRNRYLIDMVAVEKLAGRHQERREACWDAVGPTAGTGTLPRWVASRAHRLGVSPEQVWAVVQAADRAVPGEVRDHAALGTVARSVLRLWNALGRPEPAVFEADLAQLAAAARQAPGGPWAELRGECRGPHQGVDRSRSLPALCRTSAFADRLTAARAWTASRPNEGQPLSDDEPGPCLPRPMTDADRRLQQLLDRAVVQARMQMGSSEANLERAFLDGSRLEEGGEGALLHLAPCFEGVPLSVEMLRCIGDELGAPVRIAGREPPL